MIVNYCFTHPARHYTVENVRGLPGFLDVEVIDYGDHGHPCVSQIILNPSHRGLPPMVYDGTEGASHKHCIGKAIRAYLNEHHEVLARLSI